MVKRRPAVSLHLLLLVAVALFAPIALAQAPAAPSAPKPTTRMRSVTQAQRKAAAVGAASRHAALAAKAQSPKTSIRKAVAKAMVSAATGVGGPLPIPAGLSATDFYFGGLYPNWAHSPQPVVTNGTVNPDGTVTPGATITGGIQKFVNTLPGFCGVAPTNELGQCLPIATPIKDANGNDPFPNSDYYEIGLNDYFQKLHRDLNPTLLRGYRDLNPAATVQTNQYLGPFILAQRNRPVRIRFKNLLGTGDAGNLFIPVDTSAMGAGMGPDGMNSYTQNRADLHLHGGDTPWISDGTPHQWTVPAGENTPYKKGVSAAEVPDMPPTGDGELTYFYPNKQTGRLMFYHDHSYGITRLNVYAGSAAGYLLYDPVEEDALKAASVPGTLSSSGWDLSHMVPLVIQDKAFVDANTIAQEDPTWGWGSTPGTPVTGDLWFPHVYMPNQWPDSPLLDGMNPMGRWDYGPWFWPPYTGLANKPTKETYPANGPIVDLQGKVVEVPNIPNPSLVPEAFMDTPLVNGTVYPTVKLAPAAYRLRILNACNDRFLNLQLYYADPTGTEIKMVPAVSTGANWPVTWPTDNRDGGVPDPAVAGPPMIQIGTEGGLLPAPAVVAPQPVNYNYNRRDIVVLNVTDHALYLGPAERADVIVDLSGIPAGTKLILYNDAPAPVPAFDTRNDYYTGDPDQRDTGGAGTTIAGYGPNTRTIMQIVIDDTTPNPNAAPFNLAALQSPTTGLPAIFKNAEDPIVVPEKIYGAAKNNYVKIQDTQISYAPDSATPPTVTDLKPKAIQELFETQYGRMNATLGVELPNTNVNIQTTIPLGYVDPATEIIKQGDTQVWKITHNGVDTHAIHFHLFNVQVINRVGWDGAIRPPDANELGWKDTVKMNPLEDIVVALRPLTPVTPFPLPDSVRSLDVTMPASATISTFDPVTGNAITMSNAPVNFGWEYVWHCHLLGHEENDMMRPMVFQVPPEAPGDLVADGQSQAPKVVLNWVDKSASETGFIAQRDTDPSFGTPTDLPTAPASSQVNALGQGTDSGNVIALTDPDAGTVTCSTTPCTLYYRVKAINAQAFAFPPPGATTTLSSAWSNVATVGLVPGASVSPTGLDFGTQLVGTSSASQTVTLSNSGPGALAVAGITIAGVNPSDFAQNNNCGTVLNAGSSCAITVMFTPAALGARAGSLAIITNDPANTHINIPLTGVGNAPVLTLAPAMLAFGNQPVNTTSNPPLVVTVSNTTGTAPLVINNIALSGANPAEFAFTQNCGTLPATVAVGGSCTVSLTFSPAAAGARSATLALTPASPATAGSVALTGTGTLPGATLSPTSVNFGNQIVNTTSAAQTFTLTNVGLAPLSITGVSVTGVNASDFAQTSTCGASLAAGANCSVTVTFTPLARGVRTATLAVSDSASGGMQTATLSGNGLAPVATFLPGPVQFGVQVIGTTSAPQSVVLSNIGDAPLLISGITIGGVNAGDFALAPSPGNCGATLPALSSCTIDLVFSPKNSGASNGLLLISSSDPVNPVLSGQLIGTGTALAISPTALAFGNQTVGTTSSARTVTLTNAGTTALTVNGITLMGVNAADFTLNNGCGGSIRAGRSCTITVRFRPLATGALAASLNIATSDAGVPQTSVALSGTGLAAALSVSPASLTFSSPLNTTTAAQQISVSNVGTAPLTINGITLGGTNIGQFNQTSNCPIGTTLAVGASCTVNVTFRPTSAAPTAKSQTLNINVAAPATSQSVPLSGTVTLPTYAVSPGSVNFGTQALRTTSASQTVVVTNTGAVPLTLTNIAIGGVNANQFAQTNNCGASVFRPFPATLAAGASCSVNVTFSPTTTSGSAATLNVSVGGGATPAQTQVTLGGTGQ